MTSATPERSRAPLAALVAQARAGSGEAFEALVVRFQDMAFATAWAWLRDRDAARDVAQEAFFEVWRNLGRLREDAAFPGFLRRIVQKQCDRVTRRRERGRLATPGPPASGREPAPDAALAEGAALARLRAAVESLPAHERVVLAVHVLAGLSQQETADWLELPLSTVKKRVHAARARLRGGFDAMAETTLAALRPSRDARFSRLVRLFLAVREGDVRTVAALLDAEPALAEVEERWDAGLTREHALPPAAGGTPLVRAAERDHAALVELLLDRGADPDRACGCAGGESPLWAAAANGAQRAAARLLARGADPNRAAFAGQTPLHVAAIRGDDALADLLRRHGADPARRDRHGRTPADWSALRARRTSPAPSRPAVTLVPTGIRALDLFAPVAPGSLVHANFGPGQGAVVLAGELTWRWAELGRAGDGASRGAPAPCAVWAGWGLRSVDRAEIRHAFAELGIASRARLVWDDASAPPGPGGVAGRALDEAARLQRAGARDVLVVLFAQRGRAAEIDAALVRAGARAGRSITCLVMERDGDAVPDEGPLPAPWDARIVFDRARARAGRWPAVDPLRTTSVLLEPEAVGAAHVRVVDDARALVAAGDSPGLRRLHDWLVQPFFVAEAFGGRPGEWPSRDEILDGARAILAG